MDRVSQPGRVQSTARRLSLCILAIVLACLDVSIFAWGAPEARQGTAQCLGCHDFGPAAPVHAVMAGSHGVSSDDEATPDRRGCVDCHGDSDAHTQAPTQNSPDVSFGPRWSNTTDTQDSQCLACHEDDTARHWRDALHMFHNLACATCHEIHAQEDKVLFPARQAEVCTLCHKVQKQGIHGMQRTAARNPPCSLCHNPHDHESAGDKMLRNESAGCSHCHDLQRMADSTRVSDRAKRSHKAMTRPGRSCLDCHEGIAHAPADSAAPLHPVAARGRQVTLFYPGIADSEWLLEAHPGSQPLRQGARCQRCHRGEEAALGQSRAGDFKPAARAIDVSFARDGDQLVLTLRWQGSSDDTSIGLMWGDGGNEAFRRGGCFAACHSDLPGMSRDRGQQVGKYLQVSRSQQRRVGQPAIVHNQEDLGALMVNGEFIELWQVRLDSSTVRRAILLENLLWQGESLIWINNNYSDGLWTLVLRRQMDNTSAGIRFTPDGEYTFGVALNGTGNPGSKHWISLPMTLSFGRDDTDFTAE